MTREEEARQMNSLLQTLADTNARQEAELRKLCENPDTFHVCQLLMDEVYGDLGWLFNFKTVICGNGKRMDSFDVVQELDQRMEKIFKRLTGKDYVPPGVRQVQQRRAKWRAKA